MKYWQSITYILLIFIVMIVWEYSATSNTVRILISSPTLITEYFIANFSELIEAFGVTFIESISGLLIATVFSFIAMIICFYYPKIMDFIFPILIISQVIPLITLAPLFIILFGMGITAKIFMSALLCFFPIFVNFGNGVKLINKNINELMYIYNATTYQKIIYVYFPLALPNTMAGLKVAATLSVIGAIVAEFSGAIVGLGRNLYVSALRLEPELMMSSLFLSTLLGLMMFAIISVIEISLGKWYLS